MIQDEHSMMTTCCSTPVLIVPSSVYNDWLEDMLLAYY